MIAIGDHSGVVINARAATEILDRFFVEIDAPVRLEQGPKTVPKDCPWNMAGLVRRRVDMRVNDPHLQVSQMFGNPPRVNQHLRMCIVFHKFHLPLFRLKPPDILRDRRRSGQHSAE